MRPYKKVVLSWVLCDGEKPYAHDKRAFASVGGALQACKESPLSVYPRQVYITTEEVEEGGQWYMLYDTVLGYPPGRTLYKERAEAQEACGDSRFVPIHLRQRIDPA